MVKRRILFSLFVVLLVNWLIVVSNVRVYDLALSDSLGLFSVLPINFNFALIFLVFVAFLSTYWEEYYFSILFAILFSLYFHITPWIIEPLRINDSLFHYSRVAVINQLGHVPTLEKYYFDFPGSAIFCSSLLSVTGLDYLLLLKYLFPILSLFIFQLGLAVYLHKFQGLRYVGLGILLVSLFGWGGYNLSPEGLGRMFLPLILYLLMQQRKASYSLCFIVLVVGLAVSHPTTCVFLILALFTYLPVIKVLSRISNLHSPFESIITLRIFTLTVFFLLWSTVVSNTIFAHVGSAVSLLIVKLFFRTSEVPGQLVQPTYPLVGISRANYLFFALSAFLSIAMLLQVLRIYIKRRKSLYRPNQYVNLIGPVLIFVGLVFTPIFFIAGYGQYALATAAAFAFLGTSMSLIFLNLRSKRVFYALTIICLLLVVPSFISNHAYEHYNLNREPIRAGLIFSGHYIQGQDVRIYCPFGNQLYAFLDYDMWDEVISIYPFWGTTGRPIQYQGQRGDYFIYRSDGNMYAALQAEGVPLNETSYFKIYTRLLNSSNFDIVYSSKEFELLVFPP